jgi:Secretion system C-terminal sorting domain/PKD domain
MKKIMLSLTLALGTLFTGNANAQCAANGTMTPTGNPGEFTITDLSTVPGTGISYFSGGDGGMLYLQPSTTTGTYQYTANGTYTYFFAVMDSATTMCWDTLAGTIVVTGINTPPNCQASFILWQDSLNTNTYWCWNTSTASTPAMPATYYWDFGDGNSSTMAYPTHTYNGIGTYTLCLTVSFPNNCTSTYCDTIVITVKASGTTLNVLPPGTGLSLQEKSAIQDITLYPNPTNGEFTLNVSSSAATEVDVRIANIAGQVVYENVYSVNSGNNELNFDQTEVEKGVYFVTLKDRTHSVEKTLRIVKN